MNYTNYIENNTIRCETSYRGGGIEINLEPITKIEGARMASYQNYLGGGILGAICNNCSFELEELSDSKRKQVEELGEALNRYFHALTNHEGDEWEEATYEQNQARPVSAY